MKIAFDGRIFTHRHTSGVEVYAINIYKYMSQAVYLFQPPFMNTYLRHLWEHTWLPYSASNYDLLFSPANIAPVIKGKNKLVMTLHDVAYLRFPDSVSKAFYYYYKYIIPCNLKLADKVITISEYSKLEIIKAYPFIAEKIEVIYNGINHKQFSPLDIPKKEYILFVGSLQSRKNLYRLIQAYIKIKNEVSVNLKIVGNFSDIFAMDKNIREAMKLAQKEPRIHLLENVNDKHLVKLYQEAKVFVFPSIYEGFGLPPLEAMACGTPVIVSNVGALPEVCGDSALYINPYDIDDISNKIEIILSDKKLQKKMIEKGLKRVKHFSWEKSAKEHIKVFEKVLQS